MKFVHLTQRNSLGKIKKNGIRFGRGRCGPGVYAMPLVAITMTQTRNLFFGDLDGLKNWCRRFGIALENETLTALDSCKHHELELAESRFAIVRTSEFTYTVYQNEVFEGSSSHMWRWWLREKASYPPRKRHAAVVFEAKDVPCDWYLKLGRLCFYDRSILAFRDELAEVLPEELLAFDAREWSLGYRRIDLNLFAQREREAYLKELYTPDSKYHRPYQDDLVLREVRLSLEGINTRHLGLALQVWRKRFGPSYGRYSSDIEAVFRRPIGPAQLVRIVPFYEPGKSRKSRLRRRRSQEDGI